MLGTKYGFHEDGFSSGLRAAVALGGVSCPFDIQPAERDLDKASVSASVKRGLKAIELVRQAFVAAGIAWLWAMLWGLTRIGLRGHGRQKKLA